MATAQTTNFLNCIGGDWRAGSSSESANVFNPATSEVLAKASLANATDVNAAVAAASAAFPDWRRTPPQNRIQFLFKFRALLEQHGDEIARLTTQENGKTFTESRAELQRGIENVLFSRRPGRT
jgi:malonate-semialdehyde dehydrogenase (acetylating)/methylmalonate-semialdehyde dehydrogenase